MKTQEQKIEKLKKQRFVTEGFAKGWYGFSCFVAMILGACGAFGDADISTVFWWWFGITTFLFAMIYAAQEILLEKAIDEVKNEDFDLPGFGSLIWKSEEGVPINFTYTDASKKKTKRRVVMHKMMKDSKTRFYFEGYCQLRKASRTFNSDNMQDLHDENGEIIEIEDFINNLAGYKAFGNAEVRIIEE